MPVTVYSADFGSQRPMTDMDLRSKNKDGSSGITHLHYTGKALWQFGDGQLHSSISLSPSEPLSPCTLSVLSSAGLGYAELQLAWEDDWQRQLSTATIDSVLAGDQVTAETPTVLRVRVSNIDQEFTSFGTTLLGFVSSSSERFPLQRLFGFVKVPPLAPGDEAVVTLPLPDVNALSVSDWVGRRSISPGTLRLRVGIQGQWLKHERTLVGDTVVTEDYAGLFA
jgi:hypothetical protein